MNGLDFGLGSPLVQIPSTTSAGTFDDLTRIHCPSWYSPADDGAAVPHAHDTSAQPDYEQAFLTETENCTSVSDRALGEVFSSHKFEATVQRQPPVNKDVSNPLNGLDTIEPLNTYLVPPLGERRWQ